MFKPPDVLQNLDYKTILDENIANLKKFFPNWEPLESDDFTLILQAFAYRELHLRAYFNHLSSAFFLFTSTKANLDNYALFYGVKRLRGSKPYATFEFSLNEIQNIDIKLPKNLVLTDVTSKYKAQLLSDAIITRGKISTQAVVELQLEVDKSEVKTEIVTTPLPYVIIAKAKTPFANGSKLESDEEFRNRILLSMARKSTAGSQDSYRYFALSSDERIEDVKVLNGTKGVVKIVYYSPYADDLMQTRIKQKLDELDVRPLSDVVQVLKAKEIDFKIKADLKIKANQQTAAIFSNALQNLTKGLKKLKKIGINITTSEINSFLKIDGIKEVVIDSPTLNIEVTKEEIGANSANEITYTII